MICQRCKDETFPGFIKVVETCGGAIPGPDYAVYQVCPECHGAKVAHCCDGLCAQEGDD